MTVKLLDAGKKAAIIANYKTGALTIRQIADRNGVARSTIRRVLNEAAVFTPEQTKRDKGQAVLDVLARHNIGLDDLRSILSQMYDLDMIKRVAGQVLINYTPSRARILTECKNMEEGTWAAFLNEVVTARVAAAHNQHVQSAMLKIEEKVNKNERDQRLKPRE